MQNATTRAVADYQALDNNITTTRTTLKPLHSKALSTTAHGDKAEKHRDARNCKHAETQAQCGAQPDAMHDKTASQAQQRDNATWLNPAIHKAFRHGEVMLHSRKHATERTKMAGKKDTFGLTAKQLKFAQGAVSGLSLADAYRQAYDAENMTAKAIQVEASRLASRTDVALAMESISAEKVREMRIVTVSDRDNLLNKLRAWTNGEAVATASQLRAAELLGKACGIYRDVVEHTGTRSASDILADIESRLNAITPKPDDDSDSDAVKH